jgi:hypothetical protein
MQLDAIHAEIDRQMDQVVRQATGPMGIRIDTHQSLDLVRGMLHVMVPVLLVVTRPEASPLRRFWRRWVW